MDMTQLIFHIGHPKTGTTALQTTLMANADRLQQAGVLYPLKAKPTSHNHKHALAKPYLTDRENFSLRRSTGLQGDALRELSGRYWASLKDEIRDTPHQTLILSCEGFWAVPAEQEPGFRDRLAEVCDRVTVVGYLRSPARFFLSQMNQNVRMLRGVKLPRTEYFRPVIEAYRANGFDDISLNPFEPKRLTNGDIVTDFCVKYLPADLPALERGEGERGNESVSNEALAILDEVTRTYPAPSPETKDRRRNKVIDLVRTADREVGGTRRPSLKPGIDRALMARATDLPWLRDDVGVSFEDVDYDLIGTTGGIDLAPMRRVEDFCTLDPDRLAALRARTDREIARIFGVSPVRYFLRRALGSASR